MESKQLEKRNEKDIFFGFEKKIFSGYSGTSSQRNLLEESGKNSTLYH
jgi:hypothetical protein